MNITFDKGDFRKAFNENVDQIATALTAAMRETGDAARDAVRAHLSGTGFGPKWQNATRSKAYPPNGVSMSPAALVFVGVRYASIFQTGGTIDGNPLLWLPIEANLPGGTKWTPRLYASRVGELVSVNLPGKRPLLFAKGERGPPLFVGVSQVTIGKRLNVDGIVAAEAQQLPGRYEAKMRG